MEVVEIYVEGVEISLEIVELVEANVALWYTCMMMFE